VEEKAAAIFVGVAIDMVDALRVKAGGTAFEAMDFVAFFEEELGEVRAVLAGNTSD
jgi:hypothetical protein